MLDISTQVGKLTWGSKTFQYPEEKKTRPYLTFAQYGIYIAASDSEIWTFPE